MSSIYDRLEEYILTRAQYERLKSSNSLIIGATYNITDDPTVQDLIDGIYISKKALQDSSGKNIIVDNYGKKLSYSEDQLSLLNSDDEILSTVTITSGSSDTYTKSEIDSFLEDKVDKITGKQLSTNDYSNAEKTKLSNIADNATKVEVSATNGNIKINNIETTVYTLPNSVVTDNNYVHTDNNFTNTYKSNIEANNLKVSNVQSDWNSSSGLSAILNKPTNLATINDIPTLTSELTNDSGFITKAVSDLTNYYDKTESDSRYQSTLPTSTTDKFLHTNAITGALEWSEVDLSSIQDRVEDIEDLIPATALSTNKLVDRNTMNSTISSMAAFYRGSFATKALLDAYSGEKTNNDYAYVEADETHNNEAWRYIYVVSDSTGSWQAQFRVNEGPFSSDQMAAINSGITSGLVTQINTNTTNISNLQTADSNNVKLTGAQTIAGVKTFSDNTIHNGLLYLEGNTPFVMSKTGKIGLRATNASDINLGQINISNAWYDSDHYGAQMNASYLDNGVRKYNSLRISHNGPQYFDSTDTSHNLALEENIPTTLAELTDDSTHRLVTDTEKNYWNNKVEYTDAIDTSGAINPLANYYTKSQVDSLTSNITSIGVTYSTTAPTSANTQGLKFVVLQEEPTTRYNGWIYFITG